MNLHLMHMPAFWQLPRICFYLAPPYLKGFPERGLRRAANVNINVAIRAGGERDNAQTQN